MKQKGSSNLPGTKPQNDSQRIPILRVRVGSALLLFHTKKKRRKKKNPNSFTQKKKKKKKQTTRKKQDFVKQFFCLLFLIVVLGLGELCHEREQVSIRISLK